MQVVFLFRMLCRCGAVPERSCVLPHFPFCVSLNDGHVWCRVVYQVSSGELSSLNFDNLIGGKSGFALADLRRPDPVTLFPIAKSRLLSWCFVPGPLVACVKAQSYAAYSTLNFIKAVGFDPESNEAIEVDFVYNRTNTTTGEVIESSISVPMITILPIPYLRVSGPCVPALLLCVARLSINRCTACDDAAD